MIFLDPKLNLPEEFFHMVTYHPYKRHGERNPAFDANSRLLLNLKESYESAINHFHQMVDKHLAGEFVIAVVPSSDAAKIGSGVSLLAQKLATGTRVDGTSCLVRHTSIEKLATGGNRDIDQHKRSIKVVNAHLVQDRAVLLLDDITTTGNSLRACQELLYGAGARLVQCLALGGTARYE
jgi:phosphoribosylpyrophosphate synthetase